ncbi:MAG: type IV pilus biogenesis/stability protein PilW [Zoogloeaceae bacterium]|jgi:type IV pilus assembly protein PilF|nr:type IV pilus biogenesis/stability protein PilW [Zoogloeaceae bacterium]
MKKFIPALAACLLSFVFLPTQAQIVVPQSTHSNEIVSDARNQARLHTELAALYYQADAMAIALEETGIALAADPNYASAYSMRALVYTSLREFAAAETDFKKALSIAPSDPDINNNYGWFLCQSGNEKAAIPYFLSAVKNPLYTTPELAYTNAGSCALKAGELVDARAYLLQALRFSRGNMPQVQVHLAMLAYREGNLTEARNRLQEVWQAGGDPSPEALWLGVRVEHKLGHSVEEKSLTAQLRRLYPTSMEYQEFLKGTYE